MRLCGLVDGIGLVDEWSFVHCVLPALDARGLGEDYLDALCLLLWEDAKRLPTRWEIVKAPLSLRSRAALTTLEHANGR